MDGSHRFEAKYGRREATETRRPGFASVGTSPANAAHFVLVITIIFLPFTAT